MRKIWPKLADLVPLHKWPSCSRTSPSGLVGRCCGWALGRVLRTYENRTWRATFTTRRLGVHLSQKRKNFTLLLPYYLYVCVLTLRSFVDGTVIEDPGLSLEAGGGRQNRPTTIMHAAADAG